METLETTTEENVRGGHPKRNTVGQASFLVVPGHCPIVPARDRVDFFPFHPHTMRTISDPVKSQPLIYIWYFGKPNLGLRLSILMFPIVNTFA